MRPRKANRSKKAEPQTTEEPKEKDKPFGMEERK